MATQDRRPGLTADFVHGYRGARCRNNLFCLASGEIVYHTAALGIVYDPKTHEQRLFTEHDDDIISLAITNDGKYVATGQVGKDPKICVWDPKTMKPISIITGFHERGVCALSFSPDGEQLTSVGLDDQHTVAVWRWKSGHRLQEAKGHSDRIFELQYNPAKSQFVTCGVRHVSFWTFDNCVLKKRKGIFGKVGPLQTMLCVMFSSSGRAYTGALGGDIYEWDDNKLVRVIKSAHRGPVYAMLEQKDGFLTSGKDGVLRKWDLNFNAVSATDLSSLKTLDGGKPCPRAISEDKSGKVVLGLKSSDIVAVDNGKLDVLLTGHDEGEVWGLATHPTEQVYATASDDKTVRVWDIKSRRQTAAANIGKEARSIHYSPDGKTLAVGLLDGGFTVLDAQSLTSVFSDKDRKEAIHAIKYSPDGSKLAVGSHDNYVDFYDVKANYKRIGVAKGHSSFITHLDWSEDSKTLQTNSGDYEVLYWDATNRGKRITRKPENAEWTPRTRKMMWSTWTCVIGDYVEGIWPKYSDKTDVNAVDLSKDESTLATGDDFGLVKLFVWPPQNPGAKHSKHRGHSAHVTTVRFTAGDKYLISIGGGDQTVIQWAFKADYDGSDISESDDECKSDLDEIDSELDAELSMKYELRPTREELKEAKKQAITAESAVAEAKEKALAAMAARAQAAPVSRGTAQGYYGPGGEQALRARRIRGRNVGKPNTRGKPSEPTSAKPSNDLELDFVHGYRGYDARDNVFYNAENKIVYHAAALGIVYDRKTHTQEFMRLHDDDVVSLALHPNKKIVATGQLGKDPSIVVWDSTTMEVLAVLKGFHQRAVTALAFSPDGTFLASVGRDDFNSLAVYNWAKGYMTSSAKGHSDKIVGLEWSTQGDGRLISCGIKHISFWTILGNTLKKEKGLFGKSATVATVLSVAFDQKDDNISYAGTADGNILKFEGRTCTSSTPAHKGPIFTIQPAPQGFVTGGKDGSIRLWSSDLKELKAIPIKDSMGRVASIRAVDWAGNEVIAGTSNGDVLDVDEKTGKYDYLFGGHGPGELWALAVHPTKNEYCTASDDKTVRVWDLKSRKVLKEVYVGSAVRSCAYSPKGDHIALGLKDGGVQILDANLKELKSFKHRKEAIHAIKYHPTGQILAVGSHDNFVDLYKVFNNANPVLYKRYAVCKGHSSFITHLDFSADGKFLQTNSGDYERLFWFAKTSKHMTKSSQMEGYEWDTYTCVIGDEVGGIFPAYSDRTDINGCDASHNRTLLATADDFGFINLFKWPANDLPRASSKKFNGHSSHVTTCRFTHDDAYVISTGGNDMCVFHWKVTSGTGADSGESPDEFSDSDSDLAEDLKDPPLPRSERAYHGGPTLDQVQNQAGTLSERLAANNATAANPFGAPGAAAPAGEASPFGDYAVRAMRGRHRYRSDVVTAKSSASLELEWVHGVRTDDCYNNVRVNSSGQIVYHVAATGVVYDKKTHTQTHNRTHTDDIISLAMDPSGKVVATGEIGKNPSIVCWDASSAADLAILKNGHSRGVNCLAFSQSGKRLASVGLDDDHTLAVWKWASADLLASGKGHSDKILSVTWGANDEYLVTTGVKHIKFWFVLGNTLQGKKGIFGKVGTIQTVIDTAVDKAGNTFTSMASGAIYQWSRKANAAGPSFQCTSIVAPESEQNHVGPLFGLAEAANGFATGGKDGKVIFWNSSWKQESSVLLPDSDVPGTRCIRAVASENGTTVVATKRGEIYEVSGGKATLILAGHSAGELWGLATHPSNQTYASCSDDKSVRIWDIKTRKMIKSVTLDKQARACGFSPDGKLLAVGCTDGRFYILDASTLAIKGKKKRLKEWISQIKFSPDGSKLAVASHDNYTDIYDVNKGFARMARCKGHSSFITHLDWSDDSTFIQTECGAHEKLYFHAATGKHITRSKDLQGCEWASSTTILGPEVTGIWPKFSDNTDINAVDLSNDKKILATADDFGDVKLFAYPVPGQFAPFTKFDGHSSHVTNLGFTYDDSYLITAGGNDMALFQWKVQK